MSNILIIKHGSLGDIAQISGAIQDIKENHSDDKLFMLTTSPYEELFHKCPYIDEVCVDPRLSRLNLFYLLKLKQMISKLQLIKIFDLQNSSRTSSHIIWDVILRFLGLHKYLIVNIMPESSTFV